MGKQQVYNPYLPSYEYVPDGEPHVFGDRVYVYGSHDRFNGEVFCMNNYIAYSADVKDLTDWRYEGVIFDKEKDPRVRDPFNLDLTNPDGVHCLWAPDVVQGPDGKYYLYYCFDYLPEIGVAVCDSPAGSYEFLGLVKYPDGTPLGRKEGDYIQFDPGIFIDDDGEIYLYSGNADPEPREVPSNKNSQVMRLEKDMLTLKSAPKTLIPTVYNSEGTGFENHEFFEASSIRKIGPTYYFVYSSVRSHELCYCISDKPDEGYRFGGTLVSIGDIFLNGRTWEESVNFLGNTHGSLECIDGRWYVFYHRQTNRHQYSRQACAQETFLQKDGSFPQVEITSCGLNGGPLIGRGVYEARIACALRGKKGCVMSWPHTQTEEYPFFTQDGADRRCNPNQYIANLSDGSSAGYKYFRFDGLKEIGILVRPRNGSYVKGQMKIRLEEHGEFVGSIPVCLSGQIAEWQYFDASVQIADGVSALYFEYEGIGHLDMFSFELK